MTQNNVGFDRLILKTSLAPMPLDQAETMTLVPIDSKPMDISQCLKPSNYNGLMKE